VQQVKNGYFCIMDLFLLLLSIIVLFIGLAGCFLPLIPGPPLSFMALVIIHFTRFADFNTGFLLLMALVAVAVTITDFFVPVWATGKSGGSRYGIWGAGIGIIAGIFFFPPLGLITGPFAGAVIGELIYGRSARKALIAGLGSFAGFMLGIGLKLAASVTMMLYFAKAVL
jgi:uncharacterized protein